MELTRYVPVVLGALALCFAMYLIGKVSKQDAGTDRMKEIAGHIHVGAKAFLMAEYRILVIFVAILFVLIGFGISWTSAVSFLVGAVFSTAAGYIALPYSGPPFLSYHPLMNNTSESSKIARTIDDMITAVFANPRPLTGTADAPRSTFMPRTRPVTANAAPAKVMA